MKLSRRKFSSLMLALAMEGGSGVLAQASRKIYKIPAFEPELMLIIKGQSQTELEDKFGGNPFGFPQKLWPFCKTCKMPMTLLAQVQHHAVRINLGKAGRVLYLFICETSNYRSDMHLFQTLRKLPTTTPEYIECFRFRPGGGNAVIILEPEQLGTSVTTAPRKANAMLPEARVQRWVPVVDQTPCPPSAWFDDAAFGRCCLEMGRKTFDGVSSAEPVRTSRRSGFKLQGLPYWYQAAESPRVPPWRFAMQIGERYVFSGAPPSRRELKNALITHYDGGGRYLFTENLPPPQEPFLPSYDVFPDSWACDFSKFLFGGGLGYVFLKEEAEHIIVSFLFQR